MDAPAPDRRRSELVARLDAANAAKLAAYREYHAAVVALDSYDEQQLVLNTLQSER